MDCKLNISLPEETIRMIDMVIQDSESSGEIGCDRKFHQQSRAILYQAKN